MFSLKKSRRNLPEPYHSEIRECRNCGHKDNGNYCSNCGQGFTELNRPMGQLIRDLMGMIHLDTSFFRTIVPFLFKPGFLTREYLEGRRKKYLSPLRLYLFLSILFFFVARISTNQSTGLNDPSVLNAVSDSTAAISAADSAAMESMFIDSLDTGGLQIEALGDTVQTEWGRRLEVGVKAAIENPALFMDVLLRVISYALFLLMPLFAAILMLLYIRKKTLYIEHLLFAVNMHSFALLVLTIIFSLRLLLDNGDGLVNWLGIVIPVYFVAGVKRYYGQGILKVLLKVILLGIIYGLLLIITLIFIAVLTLMWM